MTKKYEKFEEWMVGKKVEDANGDVGVVNRVHEYSDAAVWVDWCDFEGKLWIDIEHLKFVEEASTKEEDVSIPWEEGQVVWDVVYGKAIVSCVEEDDIFPVKVAFDDGDHESYTLQGSFYEVGTRTLFFSEPTIIADTMPPKKPFVPKLKEGDELVVVYSDGSKDFIVVMEEVADRVFDAAGHAYLKSEIEFYKLGEEIKWED